MEQVKYNLIEAEEQVKEDKRMFCGNCGTKNEDHAMFCQNCGARLDGGGGNQNLNQNQQWQEQPVQPDSNFVYQNEVSAPIVTPQKKTGKLKIIVPAAAVVVVVFLLFSLLGGRGGYKKVVENLIEGSLNQDAEKILSVIPDAYMDYADVDKKEAISEIQDELDDMDIYDLLGDNVDIDYKIGDAEDIKGDDLKDIKEDCEEYGVKVSAAKSVDVKFTVKTDLGTDSQTVSVPVIKVGRKWYINMEELSGLL